MSLEEIYEEIKKKSVAFSLRLNDYEDIVRVFEFLKTKVKNQYAWSMEDIVRAITSNRVFSINSKNELIACSEKFYRSQGYTIVYVQEMLDSKEKIEIVEENNEEIMGEKDIIKETLEKQIVKSILPDVRNEILKECKSLAQNLTTVVVKLDEKIIRQCTESTHNKFKDLLTLVNNNIPAMLTGGAGSGKSSTCEKVAEVLRIRLLF